MRVQFLKIIFILYLWMILMFFSDFKQIRVKLECSLFIPSIKSYQIDKRINVSLD